MLKLVISRFMSEEEFNGLTRFASKKKHLSMPESFKEKGGDSEFEIDASSICTDSDSSDGLGGTVEERLERIIEKSMEKLGFDFQVTAATKDLSGR